MKEIELELALSSLEGMNDVATYSIIAMFSIVLTALLVTIPRPWHKQPYRLWLRIRPCFGYVKHHRIHGNKLSRIQLYKWGSESNGYWAWTSLQAHKIEYVPNVFARFLFVSFTSSLKEDLLFIAGLRFKITGLFDILMQPVEKLQHARIWLRPFPRTRRTIVFASMSSIISLALFLLY